MSKSCLTSWVHCAAIIVCGAGSGYAQNFPNKPLRIVTAPAGGGADYAARLIAQGITGPLGQQVIVDNRPAGIIPAEFVSRAPPDGYTMLVSSNTLWLVTFMRDASPYDPIKDFSPISLVGSAPSVLVVHPSVPVKSVKELIALAKAKPGELNYAGGAIGSTAHFSAGLFAHLADINIVFVGYKGGGPSLNALLGGEVHLYFGSVSAITPHTKTGRLRVLAVTSAQPSTLAPELPTMAAAGVPGYEFLSIDAIYAPAKTPAAIINRLNQEIVRAVNTSDIKEKFFRVGEEVVGSTAAELAAYMKADMARLGKVVKDAGIRQ